MQSENTSYTNLLMSFPPRPIKSEEDFEKTQVIVDKLLDKGYLTEEEEDYLFVLGMLIHEYEEKQDLVPDIYGVELLKVLIEEANLKQKDLVPIFKTESIVSDVLKGKRKLTVEHIQNLGEFFKVSPSVFFPANPSSKYYHCSMVIS
jgi:HTH-type transcriptional regulator/antitoxin HigA